MRILTPYARKPEIDGSMSEVRFSFRRHRGARFTTKRQSSPESLSFFNAFRRLSAVAVQGTFAVHTDVEERFNKYAL